MPGFGYGPFGHAPFGRYNWSKQVLYDYMPELDKNKDKEEGYPLLALVRATSPSFENLKSKIETFGDLRDPLLVRSRQEETTTLVLGSKVVLKGEVLQRGYTGSLTAFGEFVASNARFNNTHLGKELKLSSSTNPANNQVVVVAAIQSPNQVVIAPSLVADAGPLTWELRVPVTQPKDRTTVEVQFGDISQVAPGWILTDGFSEFEVLSRTQLLNKTQREGDDGSIDSSLRLAVTVSVLTLEDIGRRIVISGSTVQSNNDKFEIVNVVSSTVVPPYPTPYRLAELRRIGPSDDMTAGTPLIEDPGPFHWAMLDSPTLTLNGTIPAVRGSIEQKGYDAAITSITPAGFAPGTAIEVQASSASYTPDLSGTTAIVDYSAPSDTYTVKGLVGLTPDCIGKPLSLDGSTYKGDFIIESYVDSTSVRINSTLAVSESIPFPWNYNSPTRNKLLVLRGPGTNNCATTVLAVTLNSFIVAQVEPINASLDLAVPGNSTFNTIIEAVIGGVGGNSLTFASTADGTGLGTLTRSTNDFTLHYESGVTTVANVEALISVLTGGDKLIQVKTAGTGTNVLTAPGDTFTATSLAGGVDPALTLDAGPLAWELKTKTARPQTALFDSLLTVEVHAPSLLKYLATDFGIEVDNLESIQRQRSWVRHESQWLGLKGTAKSYNIIGSISGFDATALQLFRISQELSTLVPSTHLYEVGEPDNSRFGTDGALTLGTGGAIQFTSARAKFKEADVGRQIHILDPALYDSNEKLYTIDKYLTPNSVEFRLGDDTAVVPDYGKTGTPTDWRLHWNIVRLYTTLSPTRPRYDDLDPMLMADVINPRARITMPGLEAPIPPEFYGEGDLLYVAQAVGSPGNNITIEHVAGGPGVAVSVSGTHITVAIAVGVSTVADVVAAITGTPAAAALVRALAIGPLGIGHPKLVSISTLGGGYDKFAIDRFCWEYDFSSSFAQTVNTGTASVRSVVGTTMLLTDLTALTPDIVGRFVTVSGAAVPGNNGTFPVTGYLNPREINCTNPTGFIPDANDGNIQVSIYDFVVNAVALVAENTWQLTVTGPASVIQVVSGGNWRIVDANGLETYVESLPVANGTDWDLTVFSAVQPALGLPLPSPIDLYYDCAVLPICDDMVTPTHVYYCSASSVLLLLEYGSILDEADLALRLESIIERTTRRMRQVTPAHVTLIPRFQQTLTAPWNWNAEVTQGVHFSLPLYAPLRAYYDDLEGDIIPTDTIMFDAFMDGPYFTINSGSIDSVLGTTVTFSGFTGPLPDVIGQTIVVTGAATVANNGTFIITGYTSSIGGSSVEFTNAGAVAPDANNGLIGAATSA